jgi:hypothetical protein
LFYSKEARPEQVFPRPAALGEMLLANLLNASRNNGRITEAVKH